MLGFHSPQISFLFPFPSFNPALYKNKSMANKNKTKPTNHKPKTKQIIVVIIRIAILRFAINIIVSFFILSASYEKFPFPPIVSLSEVNIRC